MTAKLTPARVRRALDERYGSGEVEFHRSPSGYYYFSGGLGIDVPSLYWFNLSWAPAEDVLRDVLSHVDRSLEGR